MCEREAIDVRIQSMRFRLRTLLIVVALAPLLAWAVVSVWPPTIIVWDGGFTLQLRYVNNTGKAIDRMEAAVVSRRDEAEMYVSHSDIEQPIWKPIILNDDGIAQLHVKCSGRENPLTGRELSYFRQGAIITRIEFDDGTSSLFASDIPMARDVRSLVVPIPPPVKQKPGQ
jgi:hypothetical protein